MKNKGINLHARRIRRGLEDKGHSLSAIAQKLGCTHQYVSQVTHGHRPGHKVREEIRRLLGWNPWAASHFEEESAKSVPVSSNPPQQRRKAS